MGSDGGSQALVAPRHNQSVAPRRGRRWPPSRAVARWWDGGQRRGRANSGGGSGSAGSGGGNSMWCGHMRVVLLCKCGCLGARGFWIGHLI
jgi:hypothetical protein